MREDRKSRGRYIGIGFSESESTYLQNIRRDKQEMEDIKIRDEGNKIIFSASNSTGPHIDTKHWWGEGGRLGGTISAQER